MNYIGNKTKLLNFLENSISDFLGEIYKKNNLVFADIFSGSASVSYYFSKKFNKLIINDIMSYGNIVATAKLDYINVNVNKLKKIINHLNQIKPTKGFFYRNYSENSGRLFFTNENAMMIDSIRNEIDVLYKNKKVNIDEKNYLLYILLESVAKVSNTAIVYESFLKHYKASAKKKITLKLIEFQRKKLNIKLFNSDANKLIKRIRGDVLYIDPPYNERNYDTNYHIFETLTLNDNPILHRKAGLRFEKEKKSLYTKKSSASSALFNLIENAKFKYIFISYSSDGIIKLSQLEDFLIQKKFKYKIFKQEYKRLQTKIGDKKDNIYEYVIAIENESKY